MATLVKAILPYERASELIRRMNAAHLVGYTCLSDVYCQNNFFNPFNQEMQVLKAHELSSLRSFIGELDGENTAGCSMFGEIISWAMQDIQCDVKDGYIDARTASTLRSTLLEFRSSISRMYNDHDQPAVTFFYFHLISIMCVVYLPLFAMEQAYQSVSDSNSFIYTDAICILVVIVESMFVVGTRIFAMKLMDPFDLDLEALSVMTYVRSCWQESNRILNSKIPSTPDETEN